MVQLFLNEVAVDLPADIASQLRLNQASNPADKLDVRIGERAYSVALPATATNDRVMRHARQQLTPHKFNRTIDLSARLVVGGVQVLGQGAVCRLNSASANGYDVSLYAASVPLGETLDGLSIRDLTTLRAQSYATLSDLANQLSSTRAESDLGNILVSYGNFFSDTIPAPVTGFLPPLYEIDVPLQLDDYLLPVRYRSVLDAVFSEQGYRVEGEPLNHPLLERLQIPYTSPEPYPWPWRTLGTGSAHVYRPGGTGGTDTITGDPCELLLVPDPITYAGGAPGPTNHQQAIQYLAPVEGHLTISGLWRYSGAGDAVNATVWAVVTTPSGESVATKIADATTNQTPGNYYFESVLGIVPIPERNCTVLIVVSNSQAPTVGPWAGVTYRWDQLNLTFQMGDARETLDPAECLPEMSQKAFVKSFLTLFNADFTLDEARKVVRFYYRDVVTTREAESAIVLDEVMDARTLSYKPAAAFKKVEFTYAADSSDAHTPAGYADLTVDLSAAGRTETKQLSVPFAATATRRYMIDGMFLSPASPNYYLDIPTIADDEHLKQARIDASWQYDYQPRLLVEVGTSGSAVAPLLVGRRPATQLRLGIMLGAMVALDGTAITFNGDTGVVARNYQTTIEALRDSELAMGPIHLTPVLYTKLTPGRVVRLNGVLYRVNALTGFQPGTGKPASIELLRYLPPSGR